MQAFLSGLDIDITDARIVFTLLDVDGNGGLTVEEFVDGALKLKGPAKGIDMLSMMFDLVRYNLRCDVDLRDATVAVCKEYLYMNMQHVCIYVYVYMYMYM